MICLVLDIIAIKGHRFKADMKRYKQQETR